MENFNEYKAKCIAMGIKLRPGFTWEKSYENYVKDCNRFGRK